MWSLIVPPIIMVLGVALLVYVAAKRLPAVEERLRSAATERADETAPAPQAASRESGWKRFFWGMIEKLTTKAKIFFLRAHNRFNRMSTALREKREGKTAAVPLSETGSSGSAEEKPAFWRRRPKAEPMAVTPERESSEQGAEPVILRQESGSEAIQETETVPEPEVPAKPVAPRPRKKERPVEPAPAKTHLEEALIERIAANPRDIEAYERLGDYYLERDSLADAKECYRQVLKLSPVNRLVKIKIRRLERLLEKQ